MNEHLKTAVRLLLVLLVTAMVYSPTLKHAFVYDDHGTIAENPYLQHGGHLKDVLTFRTLGQPHVIDGQRPVLLLSTFLDRAFWGLNPQGFHATNIILHMACVTLVFLLGRRLGCRDAWSLGCALLFAVHPLAVEPVVLPSFREDLLVTLFGLLFLVAGTSERGALAAPVFLALALGSKESAVAWPVALAWLWLCLPSARPSVKARAVSIVASLALVALFLLHSFGGRPLQAADGPWNGVSLQPPANWVEAALLWWRYVALALWPHPLVADRITPPMSLDAVRIVAWLGLAALAVALLVWRRRAPVVVAGVGLALAMFAPVSNVPVPLFNPMADRYAYAMLPGLLIALVAVLGRVLAEERWLQRSVLVLAMACVVATSLRIPVWKDDRTLWTATLAQEPRSARAHTWLGLLDKADGNLAGARAHFEKAEALNPQDVTSSINLAVIDGQAGDLVAAERRLRDAVMRRPDKAEAWWNLAVTVDLQGRPDEAVKLIEKTLDLNPLHPQAREALMPALPSLW